MIGTIFDSAQGIVEVRVDGGNIYMRIGGAGFATIDQLKLNKQGVIIEHPDLKDNPEWRKEAIKRFKEKLKSYNTNKQRMDYIIEDLKKHGFKPLYQQEKGKRPVKLG